MSEINKPISVMYEEFKQELANLINNSGLPAFVIEPVLRDCVNEVRIVADNQFRSDKSAYEKLLANSSKIESETKDDVLT